MGTNYIAEAIDGIVDGCAIITAKAGSKSSGLLTSWIQQAGRKPPMVSVAVEKGRSIESVIDAAGLFGINIFDEQAESVREHFGEGVGSSEDAFAGLRTCDWGGAIAIEDCIAYVSATVYGKYDAGDHWIYVGEVTVAD